MPATNPIGYLSFDVETDGPSPLTNSLLSLGLVLFDKTGREIDSLEVNIRKDTNKIENPVTMAWWREQHEAWEYCHRDPVTAAAAMSRVARFYEGHAKRYDIRWVAGPACFDWMFLKCYYEAYGPCDRPDIGFSCRCLSERKRTFWNMTKMTTARWESLSAAWAGGVVPTHRAIDDARYQGIIYIHLRNLRSFGDFKKTHPRSMTTQ